MLIDDAGNKLSQTGPSTPVQVLGLSGVPQAGDAFTVVDEERKARQAVTYFQQKKREKELTETSKVTLEGLYNQIQEGTIKELTVIIKADVHGSLEVLSQSLQELGNKNVKITIIHSAVGSISQSDVMLASASQAIIIGFGVKPDAKAKQLAEQEKVDIRFYNIIYEVISDVTMALEGLLAPTLVEKLCGRAELKQLFHVSKIGTVGGSMVLEGKIIRNSTARVLRNGSQIHQGKFSSLKRFKDDVREVESGYECGIGIEGFDALEVGDIIESYLTEEIATKL
jgi:translation initiation factor IF-2